MRLGWALVPVGVLGLATGCRSAYVDASVMNHTGETVSLVEVDYPSASFGTQTLAAGGEFHYRFKVQGSGNLKVLWTDAERKDHTVAGPQLNEGAEGGYAIVIRSGGVDWLPKLKK